jgi:hypothetical protein
MMNYCDCSFVKWNVVRGLCEEWSLEVGWRAQEVDPKPEMTNDDVLGDAIPEEHQRDMQKICYWALGVVSVFLRALLQYR